MRQSRASEQNRWLLIVSVLLVGLVSLVQPGCDCSTDGSFGVAPVASVFPEENSDTALVSTEVVVFFGVDMNGPSVESAFTLTESGGADQPAVVVYDATTMAATLTPVADLISGTEYTATISSSIQDAAGNLPLASDFVWSFSISQATELVSKDTGGIVGVDTSANASIDGNGRFVVFESEATNLTTASTTLNRNHIYRKDNITGEVLLVSSDAVGLEANNNSFSPRISDDGRFVVFMSNATNLSSIFTGGTLQVFIKDMDDGSVDLVSRDASGLVVANNTAENPDVSNDGRFVVFESRATNLSLLNLNGATQIFIKDMSDDSVAMVSRNTTQTAGGTGDSNRPRMSPDARFIVFDSIAGSSIVATATSIRSVYLVDTSAPTVTELVSVDSSGVQGNGASVNASISDDGTFIAFESQATNLITGDTNGALSDIFRRDRTSPGLTELVSTADGITSGDDASIGASISANGSFVAFESASTNLVTETNLGLTDIFVRDFSTAPTVTVEKINLSQTGQEATNNSTNASISSDGRYVSFDSPFNYDVVDTNTINDVYRSNNNTF
ncbi:MAG: Ig-like domain-containing protein [Thiotrichales bacterium]|nr:MAG: Ig-like domain-containing protein [Thiotrichales bacterium]